MKRYTKAQVLDRLDAAAKQSGTITQWARDNGVAISYAHNVLRETAEPGPAILKALGLKRVVFYQQKEKTDG